MEAVVANDNPGWPRIRVGTAFRRVDVVGGGLDSGLYLLMGTAGFTPGSDAST
jgi:hypothetical protein